MSNNMSEVLYRLWYTIVEVGGNEQTKSIWADHWVKNGKNQLGSLCAEWRIAKLGTRENMPYQKYIQNNAMQIW